MTTVPVGIGQPIRGRLCASSGAKLQAKLHGGSNIEVTQDGYSFHMDLDSKTYEMRGPDITFDIELSNMENGILRFDSEDYPEFWLELDSNLLSKRKDTNNSSQTKRPKRKLAATDACVPNADADSSTPKDDTEEDLLMWKNVKVDKATLVVWPGTVVVKSDIPDIMKFFQSTFGIEIDIVGCVTTLPDKDEMGFDIKDSGGRHDFFFYVKHADMNKFALKRFAFQMRWWQDVYFNNSEHIYASEFCAAFPSENW